MRLSWNIILALRYKCKFEMDVYAMEMKGQKVLVVGAAVTGIPTVVELCRLGADVTLNDLKQKEEIPTIFQELKDCRFEFVGGGHPENLAEDFDFLVVSPGVPLSLPLIKKAVALGKEVISEIELASRLTHTPIVAITGTNGKTTTTALLGEIMKATGRKTFVTGNIGHAMITEVAHGKPEDVFVLEVSSFQLETTHRL